MSGAQIAGRYILARMETKVQKWKAMLQLVKGARV
jgi:hypothetical protein